MSNYDKKILSLNPLAYWKLNENGGNKAFDSATGNYTGVFAGSPSFNNQHHEIGGTSVYLNGSSYFDVTGRNFLKNVYEATFEFWINFTLGSGQQDIFDLSSSGSYGFSGGTNGDAIGTGTNGTLHFGSGTSSNYAGVVTSTNSWNDGKWHHVVMRYKASGAGFSYSDYHIYIDGIKQSTVNSLFGSGATPPVANSGTIRVGSNLFGNSGGYIGYLDNFAVYDYALDAGEIRNNYIVGKTNSLDYFDYTQLVSIQNQLPTNFYTAPQTWVPKKPIGEVTVDWSHPQAKNLAAFILFDGTSNAFDLVSGKRLNWVGTTTYLRGSTVGDSSDLDSSDNFTLDHSSNFFKQQTEYTVVWHGILDSTANFQHFAGKHSGNGGGGDNYFDFRSENGNTTVVVAGSGVNSGLPISLGDTKVAFSRHDPESKVHFYVDGATSTQSLGSLVTTEYTGPLYIGRRPDGACQIDGAVSCVAVWARSFELDEFRQVADNPYLILKSANNYDYLGGVNLDYYVASSGDYTDCHPPAGSLSLTGYTPVTYTDQTQVYVPFGALDLTEATPQTNATEHKTSLADFGSITYAANQHYIQANDQISLLGYGTRPFVGLSPVINAQFKVGTDLPIGAVDLTGYTASFRVGLDSSSALAAGSLSLIGVDPQVTYSGNIFSTPALGVVDLTPSTFTTLYSGNIFSTADFGAASFTGYPATITYTGNRIVRSVLNRFYFDENVPSAATTANKSSAIPVKGFVFSGNAPTTRFFQRKYSEITAGAITFAGLNPGTSAIGNVRSVVPLANVPLASKLLSVATGDALPDYFRADLSMSPLIGFEASISQSMASDASVSTVVDRDVTLLRS